MWRLVYKNKMNTLPIELVEQIISNLPTPSLSNICHTNKALYILSRIELYKRWKKYAIKFGKLYYEELDLDKQYEEGKLNQFEYNELICQNALKQSSIIKKQISVMKIMLNNKMITDPQEKEICRYCTSEWNWFETPIIWELDWKWEADEYEEEVSWQ